jgi:hypothetical protein
VPSGAGSQIRREERLILKGAFYRAECGRCLAPALRIFTRRSNIMRWIMSVAILVVLLLGPELSAHPMNVIGTIMELHDTQLVVKTNDGYFISFTLDSSTVIQRGEKKVDITELKTGLSVVVDALDDVEPIVASQVTIVPSRTRSRTN